MRCINIDWLELYCSEDIDRFPLNAEYYRNEGWDVIEREYGTRQYKEMFTLVDTEGNTFLEVRRNPVAAEDKTKARGIFSEFSCHVRLVNRYCYRDDCIFVLSEFLHRYGYTVNRIFRIDLALDFTRFDSGDDPKKFLLRFMAGRYAKINQCHLSAHAVDNWERRDWNSVSWGSEKSMVSTKFYNKTLELKQAKDKPYIRLAWLQCGLVDEPNRLYKIQSDGSLEYPDVWRLEFSIKAPRQGVFVIDSKLPSDTKTLVRENTLGTYDNRQKLLHVFADLAAHYFCFKKYQKGKRKDRCPDKVLFNFAADHEPYRLRVLGTDRPQTRSIDILLRHLREYREKEFDSKIRNACDVVIDALEDKAVRLSVSGSAKDAMTLLLQILAERRMNLKHSNTFEEDLQRARIAVALQHELFIGK